MVEANYESSTTENVLFGIFHIIALKCEMDIL